MSNKDASIGSISDLYEFSHKLAGDSSELINMFAKLNQQMKTVCEGWNDEQNTKFMIQFVQKQKEIKEMALIMQEYSAFIQRIAKAAEEYKNTH